MSFRVIFMERSGNKKCISAMFNRAIEKYSEIQSSSRYNESQIRHSN